MAYASFEHDVTRPVEHVLDDEKRFVPDPHLHTHCFVMNASWNEKLKRYQAIEIGNIKKNAPTTKHFITATWHRNYRKQDIKSSEPRTVLRSKAFHGRPSRSFPTGLWKSRRPQKRKDSVGQKIKPSWVQKPATKK
jgi:hypothetical protein